jgi:hypothetical protein
MSGTPEHTSWENMWNRCTPGSRQNRLKRADTYRTITVCDRWKSFENFFADMGRRPPGKTLDRIDNSKGYSPENCRWATRSEQQKNRSVNHMIEVDGRRQCLADWSRETGVTVTTILGRIQRKIPLREAIGLDPYRNRKTLKALELAGEKVFT